MYKLKKIDFLLLLLISYNSFKPTKTKLCNKGKQMISKIQKCQIRLITKLLLELRGRTGVKQLQKTLNLTGKRLKIDGIFGPITLKATNSVDSNKLCQLLEQELFRPLTSLDTKQQIEKPFWLKFAYEELGTKEIKGKKSNHRIEQYHSAAGGVGWKDDVPWCASFVTFIMVKAGFNAPKYPARALSWLKFGVSSHIPVLGAIAVKKRKGGGHVTFVVGKSKNGKYLYCLGGNQNDAVNIKKYPAHVFVDFRIPIGYSPSQELPILKSNTSYHPVKES